MVPEGTFAVGAGLAIAGVTTYGFQILAFRGLSKPNYAALNALWVFVFVLAPGIFLPVEQEVGRALAARRAHGIGGAPVIRRAGVIGLMFATSLGLATIVLALTTTLVDSLFAGNAGLVICLVVALFTFAATAWLFITIPKGFFPQQDIGLITGISEAGAERLAGAFVWLEGVEPSRARRWKPDPPILH